jgi:hypothetical protein
VAEGEELSGGCGAGLKSELRTFLLGKRLPYIGLEEPGKVGHCAKIDPVCLLLSMYHLINYCIMLTLDLCIA